MIAITAFKESPNGYSDTYVTHDRPSFSFIDKKGRMVGPLVDCKGYVKNRVHGSILKTGQHDYKYDTSWGTVDLESLRLLVVRRAKSFELFEKEIKLAVRVLNKLEKDLGLVRSTYHLVSGLPKDYGHGVLLIGSKRWLLSPVMLDLYISIIRNARDYSSTQGYTTLPTPEGNRASEVAKHLVKNKYWKVFGKSQLDNWPTGVQSSTIHEMGITWFLQESIKGTIKKHWPHWLLVGQAA